MSCRCGLVRGVLHFEARDVCRVRCYCDDCQACARHLGGDVVDAYGGTSVVQTSPARVRLTGGLEHLGCLQLAAGGLLRWHAECCRTPIANTMRTSRLPFVGVAAVCLADQASLEAVAEIGVQGRFAIGGSAPDTHRTATPGVIVRSGRVIARAWWRGDASPFFDGSGLPRVTPRVLTPEERAAAYA